MGFHLGGHPNAVKTSGPTGPSSGSFTLGGSHHGSVAPAAASSKKKGGGLLGEIGHAVAHGAHVVGEKADLAAHDIKSIPGGMIDLGQLEYGALKSDVSQAVHHPLQTQSLHEFVHGKPGSARAKLAGVERQTVHQSVESLKHPGRDPFQTLMTALPVVNGGASALARLGAAGDAAGAAAGAGKVAAVAKALASKPEMAPRLLKAGDTEVPLQASKRPLRRAGQAVYDKALQHSLDAKPEGRVAGHAQKRIGGALDEAARVQQRLREAPANALDVAGKRLSSKKRPGQGRVNQAALELTSVNTTAEKAAKYHLAQAEKGVEPARNRAVAKLYQTVADRGLLTTNKAGDVIVNQAEHPKLAAADQALAKVQGRGDEILKRYDVRSADQLAERVNAPARVREGASYETPTPAKQGVASQSLTRMRSYVTRLETLHGNATKRTQRMEFTAADQKRIGPLSEASNTSVDLRQRLAPMERELRKMTATHNAPATSLIEQRAGLNRMLRIGNEASKAVEEFAAQVGKKSDVAGLDDLKSQIDALTEQIKAARGTEPEQLTKLRRSVQQIRRQVRSAEAPRSYIVHGEHPYVVSARGEIVRPNGSARAEQLSGALSVAKDRLQQMEEAAQRRVKPTGMLGGETARPGRGFVSYATTEKRMPTSSAAASGGPVVGEAHAPINNKTFTGSSIEHGHVPKDITGQAARHLRGILRFVNTTERRNDAIRTGSNVRRSERDVLVKVPGEDHAKIPQAVEEILGRKKATTDDINGLNAALDAYRQELIPGLQDRFSADKQQPVGVQAPEGYKWVDKGALGQLAHAPLGPRGRVARAADNINSAVTAATVYFKIGHIGTRVLTNATTNILQGSAKPAEIADSVNMWHALSDEDRMRAFAASGQHGFAAMPHAGTSLASRVAGRGSQWWAKHADAPFRFNSIAYEARHAGYRTPEQFRDMLAKLENPHEHNMSAAERSKVMGVANRANREGIAYDRLNETEKRYLTRGFWFYPWVKGATMFAGNTLLEHPYKAAVAGVAGVEGRQMQQSELGDLPTYEGGLFKLGGSTARPLVADFSTFSPFATPADLLNTVARPSELAGMLNPAYSGVNAYINGLNRYGDKLSPGQNALVEALATVAAPAPETQILSGYLNRNKPQGHKMFPASPALHGTLSPLLRALVGPGLPRQFNPAAARADAKRQRTGR